MNVAGIGIDIVGIERFKTAAEQRGEGFLKKIFTQGELDYAGTKPEPGYIMQCIWQANLLPKRRLKKLSLTGLRLGLTGRTLRY